MLLIIIVNNFIYLTNAKKKSILLFRLKIKLKLI